MPPANRAPVVVVGAGHAGLAVSYHLTRLGIDHIVLERGEVANTWSTERWRSLRLLTPNWLAKLPGYGYQGPDPDGFMTVNEVVDFITAYSAHITAPVETRAPVEALRATDDGYEVATPGRTWHAQAVVLATGAFNVPRIPAAADQLPGAVESLAAFSYEDPHQLPDGPVLVVGASATGVQLALEIQQSDRQVILSTGEHVRMPRTYRGRDIFWWLGAIGRHDERYDEVDDLIRARSTPSPQLEGNRDRDLLDLNALRSAGVKVVGRLGGISDGRAHFSGSLSNLCALADLKMARLLDAFDEWGAAEGRCSEFEPTRYPPTVVDEDPSLSVVLGAAGVRAVVWATGYRSDYSWLGIPVLDRKGEIRHDGGVVRDAPGMYRIGLNFLRRRKSSFIHGADDDARDIVEHLARYIGVPSTTYAISS